MNRVTPVFSTALVSISRFDHPAHEVHRDPDGEQAGSFSVSFVESGGFPRTEIRAYGDVAVLYTSYAYEIESGGQRQVQQGRGTEVFVHRDGRWVNPGWHLDSGR